MKSKSIISIDGANCVQTDDGSIFIKRRTFSTWLVVVVLALFSLCIIWLTVGSIIRQGLKVEDLQLIPIILLFAGLIFVLTRPLRMPSIQFKASARMLEIGRGISPRQIPFSSVSYIATIPGSGPLKVTVIQILAVLNDKEIIPIGRVSGNEKKAHSRATTVAQLLANMLGVEMRQELHSVEKGTTHLPTN